MMGLGTLLEKARLEQGLTIEDLARRTKIRPQFLQAIEEEQFHLLPGEAYVKPFIRSYAKALGVEDQLNLVTSEVVATQEVTEGIRERREKAKKARRKRFVVRLVLALAILAGVGYLVFRLMNV